MACVRHIVLGLLMTFAAAVPAGAQQPSLRVGDWLRVDFRARVQADIRRSQATMRDTDNTGVDIARRRVGVDGRVGRIFDYQVEYELGDRMWRDVYLDYRQFPVAQLKAGQFKLPFGLEETTSSTNLDFVYRARVSARLAPGRDRGATIHGRLLQNALSYEGGVFRHDGDNARPSASVRVFGSRTVAARIVVRPFRAPRRHEGTKASASPFETLQLGAAVAVTKVPTGFPGVRARTVLGASFYDSDVWVKGRRQRTGLEARWRPGRLSVQAEYIRLTDERRGQSVEDGDLSPLVAHGWYASATWALTARRTRYGKVELAARYETLSFGSGGTLGEPSTSTRADVVFGNADRALTMGANWHINRWIKAQVNVIREDIERPSLGPIPATPAFWSRVFRLQFAI
jgi:phosphate-selective porin OprO/OprP